MPAPTYSTLTGDTPETTFDRAAYDKNVADFNQAWTNPQGWQTVQSLYEQGTPQGAGEVAPWMSAGHVSNRATIGQIAQQIGMSPAEAAAFYASKYPGGTPSNQATYDSYGQQGNLTREMLRSRGADSAPFENQIQQAQQGYDEYAAGQQALNKDHGMSTFLTLLALAAGGGALAGGGFGAGVGSNAAGAMGITPTASGVAGSALPAAAGGAMDMGAGFGGGTAEALGLGGSESLGSGLSLSKGSGLGLKAGATTGGAVTAPFASATGPGGLTAGGAGGLGSGLSVSPSAMASFGGNYPVGMGASGSTSLGTSMGGNAGQGLKMPGQAATQTQAQGTSTQAPQAVGSNAAKTMGLPGQPPSPAAPGAAQPGITGNAFIDDIIGQFKKNALQIGLGVGSMMLAGSKADQMPPALNELTASGQNAQAIGNEYIDAARAGKLTAPQQASMDQYVQRAKNQIRQYFAGINQFDSTARIQAEQLIDQEALAMQNNLIQTTLDQGLKALQVGQGPIQQVAQYQAGQDQALIQAMGNFAGGLGNLFGRGASQGQVTQNTAVPTIQGQ